MAYRKGYYRKDGTYVSDSFDSRGSRKRKPLKSQKSQNKGCLLLLIVAFILGIFGSLQ